MSSLFQQNHNGISQEGRGKPVEAEALTLFEDLLERGVSLRVRVTGESMKPFLQGGEIATIRKESPDVLRKGDLIFFKNNHGPPLLHRIVQKWKTPGGAFIFRTKGDGLFALDEPVSHHNILGKVSRIERVNTRAGSKYRDMESLHWRTINAITACLSLLTSRLRYSLSKVKILFS